MPGEVAPSLGLPIANDDASQEHCMLSTCWRLSGFPIMWKSIVCPALLEPSNVTVNALSCATRCFDPKMVTYFQRIFVSPSSF